MSEKIEDLRERYHDALLEMDVALVERISHRLRVSPPTLGDRIVEQVADTFTNIGKSLDGFFSGSRSAPQSQVVSRSVPRKQSQATPRPQIMTRRSLIFPPIHRVKIAGLAVLLSVSLFLVAFALWLGYREFLNPDLSTQKLQQSTSYEQSREVDIGPSHMLDLKAMG